jgi:hypothetical protein
MPHYMGCITITRHPAVVTINGSRDFALRRDMTVEEANRRADW